MLPTNKLIKHNEGLLTNSPPQLNVRRLRAVELSRRYNRRNGTQQIFYGSVLNIEK